MGLIPERFDMSRMTTQTLGDVVRDAPVAIALLPVGSTEPHGPHLPLSTDTVISLAAGARAAEMLETRGVSTVIAPPVPYGVTECAGAFAGAVTVPAKALVAYLKAVIDGLLRTGFAHVCLVNNHLEPEHDSAVREAIGGFEAGRVSVASPLTRRWARTLSDEFKKGECHAGCYETSIVMSADLGLVDDDVRRGLPEVPVSLSEKLSAGVTDFVEMGLADAYAGAPARANAEHGREQTERLAEMIVGEVCEATGV